MAGYSKEELIDELTDGFEVDELDAEHAVDKFYAYSNGGALPQAVATDLDAAAEHVYTTREFWEE